jgi:hypothetical protein
MVRPTRSIPNDFGALGGGDLSPPPPTTLIEAFVAAHTEVLCQILQAQQRMAQQLQQMPLMQYKLRPFKPCLPRVPTQADINAIVGAIQMLEGQNSVLNQIVYDIIKDVMGDHLRLVWQTVSLNLYLHIHGRAGLLVQSVGGAWKSRATPGLRLHITTFSITSGP